MAGSVTTKKISAQMPSEKGVHFFKCVGHCAGVTANCLCNFYVMLQNMDAGTIQFYLQKTDFRKWLQCAPGVEDLAKSFSRLSGELSGETLKKELLDLVQGAASELKKRC